MFKPASLRSALSTAIVDSAGARIFERDPDKLKIWCDKGRIAGRLGQARGFEYRYRLNALVMDFTGDEDAIAIVITEWVREHQPDLLLNHQAGDDAIGIEIEVLEGDLVDLLFTLNCSETVRLLPRDAGGFDAQHEPEPSIEDLLLGEAMDGAPERPPLGQVYAGGQLIVASDEG
jgi:hypothetical protein